MKAIHNDVQMTPTKKVVVFGEQSYYKKVECGRM